MTKVDVIVTNHDLVLADLALGGGAILPDPRETLYVFDEGHHLPDKAIGHFAHSPACALPPTGWSRSPRTSPSCSPSTRCRATSAA